MLNILVLGMGSNVSQGIVKALRQIEFIPIRIFGACVNTSSVGLYLCDEALLSPYASSEDFVHWYINTCKNKNIDMVFTGVEENINALVSNRPVIESEVSTKFAYPGAEAWKVGYDKYETCKWLKKHDIPYPNFALASDDIELARLLAQVGVPLIAKPRSGKSSYGIIVAHCLKDLVGVIGSSDYIVQECVGSADNEYTVGCYFSKKGEMTSSIVMHRFLKNGSTSMAEIVENEAINGVVAKIAENINTAGPLNIQFRLKEDGTPICFEWNVRYSGATAIRNHFGFHDVEAAIREYVLAEDDISSCFTKMYKGVALRREDELYFDELDFQQLYREKEL